MNEYSDGVFHFGDPLDQGIQGSLQLTLLTLKEIQIQILYCSNSHLPGRQGYFDRVKRYWDIWFIIALKPSHIKYWVKRFDEHRTTIGCIGVIWMCGQSNLITGLSLEIYLANVVELWTVDPEIGGLYKIKPHSRSRTSGHYTCEQPISRSRYAWLHSSAWVGL